MQNLQTNEIQLIENLKGVDDVATLAFDEIYYMMHASLSYFADNLIDNKQEANDIMLEAMAKAWSNRKEFDTLNHMRYWLYHVVRNQCLRYIDNRKARREYEKQFLQNAPYSENKIDRLIDQAELIRKIYHEIENLPDKCKEVFKLTYLERLSRNEVAEMLGVSANTVRNQNARAIELLRLAFDVKEWLIVYIILNHHILHN